MKLCELVRFPTSIDKVHESCFRAFHVLRYVAHLLEHNTPPDIVLELIQSIGDFPAIENSLAAAQKAPDFYIPLGTPGLVSTEGAAWAMEERML